MKEHISERQSHGYAPAIEIAHATLRFSINKIPVCTINNPQHICGKAHRVGYTGTQDHDQALYRLKIRMGNGHPTFTLPGFYIIEDGVFQEYEQRK